MPEYWPDTVPSCMTLDSLSVGYGDPRIKSQTDAGPAKMRRRSSAMPRTLSGTIPMSYAQLASLETFVNDTTLGGSLAFVFPSQHGGDVLARLADMPSWQRMGSGKVLVNLSLETLPAPTWLTAGRSWVLEAPSTGQRATVDFDFVNDRYFLNGAVQSDVATAGVVCTRNLAALAQNVDGSWTTFAANVPRITDKGLLVEEARTNLVTNSDPTAGTWYKATGSTVVAVAGSTPFGEGAFRLTSTTTDGYCGQGSIPVTAGSVYTGSVWLRADVPKTIQLHIVDTGGLATAAACSVTTSWQRFTVSRTIGAGITAASLQIGGGNSLGVGATLDIVMPQLELGAFATSPILTSGSTVTRPYDAVTVPTLAAWANANNSTFTAFSEHNLPQVQSTTAVAFGWAPAADFNNAFYAALGPDTSYNVSKIVGGVSVFDQQPTAHWSAGATYRGATAISPTSGRVAGAGTLATAGDDTSIAATSAVLNSFTLGSAPWNPGSGNNINGCLRRLALWDARLSNADLQAITL